MMLQFIKDQPPKPLAPVYYCPHAKTGTLSPRYLQLYNKCSAPTHWLVEYLSIGYPIDPEIQINTVSHNNPDSIDFPIIHFSKKITRRPTIVTL